METPATSVSFVKLFCDWGQISDSQAHTVPLDKIFIILLHHCVFSDKVMQIEILLASSYSIIYILLIFKIISLTNVFFCDSVEIQSVKKL